ncbi:agmatinase [Clostridiales bacterium PH28_bin88]|nr:agmatinase [Clostridiales bacterium PH28_bin88]
MGSVDNYQEADIALVGAPMDFTVSFRPGTRMGPRQIRTVSVGLEEYSVYLNRSLDAVRFFDCGDVSLPFGNVQESLDRIFRVARQVVQDGKFPLFLGGEHLVTYPIVKAVKERYADLVVVHFDAHADLRLSYEDQSLSHATVMRKVCDLVEPLNVYQLGIRSGIKEEFDYANENTNMYIDQVKEPLSRIIEEVAGRPVYITLDIDVVDPAYAPGTGTPEPGGCTAREIIEAIHLLGGSTVVGFDLVEVSPVYDPSERTALLAAKLVREAMLSFC